MKKQKKRLSSKAIEKIWEYYQYYTPNKVNVLSLTKEKIITKTAINKTMEYFLNKGDIKTYKEIRITTKGWGNLEDLYPKIKIKQT
jgi:phosphomannomutase